MSRDKTVDLVDEVLQEHTSFNFDLAIKEKLIDVVYARRIFEDYDEGLITRKEGWNMVLYEDEILLKAAPHKRSAPQPPKHSDKE